jgi:hypothetical protein
MKNLLAAGALALAVLAALAAPAQARRHKPDDRPTICHNPVDVMRPCPVYFSNALRAVFTRMGRGVTAAAPPVRRGVVLGGRPTACRGIPWCGCWLRLKLGIADARLNLARAWARYGVRADGPAAGVIAVWRHHVGKIVAVTGPGRIVLQSGNDGGAVRERERSTRGVIAYRRPA